MYTASQSRLSGISVISALIIPAYHELLLFMWPKATFYHHNGFEGFWLDTAPTQQQLNNIYIYSIDKARTSSPDIDGLLLCWSRVLRLSGLGVLWFRV